MEDRGDRRRFIHHLSFWSEDESIEAAQEKVHAALGCSSEAGLVLIDGTTTVSREREAIESMTYGSTQPYRNLKAERGEWAPTSADREQAPSANV